jgi:ATP-dependent helicase HrpB
MSCSILPSIPGLASRAEPKASRRWLLSALSISPLVATRKSAISYSSDPQSVPASTVRSIATDYPRIWRSLLVTRFFS